MRRAITTAYPRIHVTLVDLGNGTGRRYGGAGFALDGLTTTARARTANKLNLLGPAHFEAADLISMREAVKRLCNELGVAFDVQVECQAPSHVGLGTKTTCILAALRACNAIASDPLVPESLIKLAGRGGTSGVGVNSAFCGGFVVDAGQPAAPKAPLLPSSAKVGTYDIPPAIVKVNVPERWRIHLFLPNGQRVTGQVERDFFARNTPIPRWEVLEVLASLYHGVVPAIASAKLSDLAYSLRQIHEFGFKKREVAYQGNHVVALLQRLDEVGSLAAGMSSMGPLIYAIAACESEELTTSFRTQYGSMYLGQFKARNNGSVLQVSDSDGLDTACE